MLSSIKQSWRKLLILVVVGVCIFFLFGLGTTPPHVEQPLTICPPEKVDMAKDGILVLSKKGWETELIVENFPEHGYFTAVPLDTVFPIHEAGFYVLTAVATNKNENCVHEEKVFFAVLSRRGEIEWGLHPLEVDLNFSEEKELEGTEINVYYPNAWPKFILFPVVVKLTSKNNPSLWVQKNAHLSIKGEASVSQFPLTRGYTSTFLNQRFEYNMWIKEDSQFLVSPTQLTLLSEWPEPEAYIISKDTSWPEGTVYKIQSNIVIEKRCTLEIGKNSSLILASDVSFIVYGYFFAFIDANEGSTLVIKGDESNLVTFCANKAKDWGSLEAHWGGIHVHPGGLVNFTYTMLSKASGIPSNEKTPSLRSQRHIIILEFGSRAILDNVFFVGQSRQFQEETSVFRCRNSYLNISRSYIGQFASGGELYNCNTDIFGTAFSGFPGTKGYKDRLTHSDGLFIAGGTAVIRESVFMLANDDCLEVSPSSKVQIVDSRFESCYHECLTVHQENSEKDNGAGSVSISNSILEGCQQGIELGVSPKQFTMHADHCLFQHNLVGARMGDSQATGRAQGKLVVENSVFFGNHEDTWNYVRQTSEQGALEIRHSLLEEYAETAANTHNNIGEYPILFKEPSHDGLLGEQSLGWNAASDGKPMGLLHKLN